MCAASSPETSAATTFPSAESERLMAEPSFCRSLSACVFSKRSEPARSMSESLERETAPESLLRPSISTVKMRCDLDESAFMRVAPTCRFEMPCAITPSRSRADRASRTTVSEITISPRSPVRIPGVGRSASGTRGSTRRSMMLSR
eukprot:Amastigsp_a150_24.p4 type:complete len:146 gc:universal Amastigsp_a150_24:932-495(-)